MSNVQNLKTDVELHMLLTQTLKGISYPSGKVVLIDRETGEEWVKKGYAEYLSHDTDSLTKKTLEDEEEFEL